jgi:hypothetical protein
VNTEVLFLKFNEARARYGQANLLADAQGFGFPHAQIAFDLYYMIRFYERPTYANARIFA